jgi:hypothetical protein
MCGVSKSGVEEKLMVVTSFGRQLRPTTPNAPPNLNCSTPPHTKLGMPEALNARTFSLIHLTIPSIPFQSVNHEWESFPVLRRFCRIRVVEV